MSCELSNIMYFVCSACNTYSYFISHCKSCGKKLTIVVQANFNKKCIKCKSSFGVIEFENKKTSTGYILCVNEACGASSTWMNRLGK